ncbi:hypothetical protein AA0228_1878 [Gluconobacter frateurii NRIC 0228]|uniref:Uncharacterized protein n=1 Tax=Gluconobacter frateurii NRIC 0228 TaxID=1307946 RepID=A0ABQ0QCM2_9PROT|nr:hypothetical protein AA0228_1878 [Gluconobacter frateurii NRIC 0228]
MLKYGGIASQMQIAGNQRQCQAGLPHFRATHRHQPVIADECSELVVEYGSRDGKTAPLQISQKRGGENILKAVIFRAFVIPINNPIPWPDTVRTHHGLFDKGMPCKISPVRVWQNGRQCAVQNFVPDLNATCESLIELHCARLMSKRPERNVARTINGTHDCSILDQHHPRPGWNLTRYNWIYIRECQDFPITPPPQRKLLDDDRQETTQQAFPATANNQTLRRKFRRNPIDMPVTGVSGRREWHHLSGIGWCYK